MILIGVITKFAFNYLREEHGYPGDSSFPYFWKSSISGEWEVNSCTDKPLNGEYRSV